MFTIFFTPFLKVLFSQLKEPSFHFELIKSIHVIEILYNYIHLFE